MFPRTSFEEQPQTLILFQSIKNHLQYLRKYQQEIIRPLCHFTYPSKQLIVFYQQKMIPKLQKRKNSTCTNVSDILYWFTPELIGHIHRIEKYIVSAKLEQKNTDLKAIMPEIGDQCTVQSMLRIPQVFLQHNFLQQVKSAIKYSKNKNNNKQSDSLKRFSQLYEHIIEKYKKNIEIATQDVQRQVLAGLFPDVPNPRSRVAVKFGTRAAFKAKLLMRVKKANKNLLQRKLRIKQLIDGQKKYVQGLQQYIQYVKKPIIALGILIKQQQFKLFSSIEQICKIHQHFYEQLSKNFQKYDKYQCYGDIIRKNVPFFMMYTDYILYADEAQALLLSITQQHPEVQEICDKFMLEKQKKASDQLKQPTFRIARYEMILNEIIKKTNPSHPDYQKLVEAQKSGIHGLRKMNQTVDKTYRSNRMNQLEQQFGTEQRPIYETKREFLEQFNLFLVRDEKLEPIIVFVFSDFVMLIDEHRKILKWITIDQNFYVRREEDNKIYRNIIKIHSDGFMTFSAGSEDKNFNKAQQFFQLLKRVSKQNQQSSRMVYVQVIGTEQIGSTSFAKHTEYIVQIKFLGLRKYIHLRFSGMRPLLSRVQLHYQDDLNITDEQALRKNWFNNHKSKTIEDRKRTIEQILQKILNHELIRKNPTFILNELTIQPNFLDQVNGPQKKRQTFLASNLRIDKMETDKKTPTKKELKQAQTILCATQIKLGRDVYHDPDQVFLQKKMGSQSQKVDIYIKTMVGEDPVVVKITESYTVDDVCHKLSKMIGLRTNRDFRLFHQIGKKELRVLDPQQKIMKIFTFPKRQTRVNGFFSDIFGSFKRIISPESHPTLIYKKYYFLPPEIEQAEAKKDLTRLRLIVYQIFSEIKDMKYQLSFDEYLLFLAMMIYIESDGQIPEEVTESYVHRLIPQTIFKLKNYSQEQWILKCQPHILRLKQEIKKIINYNTQQLKLKKIKTDSVSKTALYFGHRHLCSQIVVNKIKNNPIYGSNLFYIQPYKSTYDKLAQQGCKMAYNMWLAIKVQSLNLLTPSSKQTVLELKYKDIEKIFVYSEAIIFKMDGILTEQYRLNTYQSFQISQLVKYNKALNDTLDELQRNQDLIEKARMYKQELLIYRNTYDKSERQTKTQQ